MFSEAIKMMRRWKYGGGRIVGVSNQGGVALGFVEYGVVVRAMIETQRQAESLFDKIAFCCHHPDAHDPEMARCWCRKPSPGLLIESALSLSEKYRGEIYPPWLGLFVGDRSEDEECARLSGFHFQEVRSWRAEA